MTDVSTHTIHTIRSARSGSAFATTGGGWRYRATAATQWLFDLLLTWQARAEQRHTLASFDARMLKDIGLTQADVRQEIRKPFWLA